MTEHELQTAVLKKYGSRKDMKIWRNNTGVAIGFSFIQKARKLGYFPESFPATRYGVPGAPDIMGFRKPNGQFIGIETKDVKRGQTEEQKVWQEVIESMGGIYILAKKMEDVDEVLS